MLQTVQRTMEEQNMVLPQERLLVGVSGGADSVCLLLVLQALSKEQGFFLEAVHVEHGIRGEESLCDEQFVVELCRKLEVPLTCVHVDVPALVEETGMSVEEAARVLRYEAFSNLAKEKKAKLALAHHMEDNAETVLFQMLRGSSITGLCGMQPKRWDKDGVEYIRPLLFVHRKEIEDYLALHGQSYCTDSTNQELEYSRNYLRNVVLPELTQVNEQAVTHINQTAEKLSVIRDFLDTETRKAWECLLERKASFVNHNIGRDELEPAVRLHIPTLLDFHAAVQREIILRAIATVSGSRKDLSSVHVTEVLELCQKQSGREVHLPYDVVARREFDWICLDCGGRKHMEAGSSCVPKAQLQECGKELEVSGEALETIAFSKEALEVALGEPEELLRIKVFSYNGKSAEIPKKPYTKWLDYDKIKEGFCIRTRKERDYFISDTLGHHKKLKTYFIDEKISASKRDRMWLLAQDSQVLWLIGGRISEHIKVTEKTKQIVEIEYRGGR